MTPVEHFNIYQRSSDGVWVMTAKHGEMVETIELYKYVGRPVQNADEANTAGSQWLADYEQKSKPQEERQAEQPEGEPDMAEAVKSSTRVRKAAKAKAPTKKRTTRKRTVVKKSTGVRRMSDEHKKALADGRTQARVVNTYLSALESVKPKRGRRRTQETVQTQLDKIEVELKNGVGGVTQLSLVQQRRDLTVELASLVGAKNGVDIEEAQAEFVKVAKAFGATRGITYGAWREVGVPAEVLKDAGITRGKSE